MILVDYRNFITNLWMKSLWRVPLHFAVMCCLSKQWCVELITT